MKIHEVRDFYQYVFWAHERMMSVVQQLKPEEFTRDLGSSFGSVRCTLVHLMSVEWLYLSRWHGVFPNTLLDAESFPTLEALEERWLSIRRELTAFLARVRDEDLKTVMIYRNLRDEEVAMPLQITMMHVVNHNTYHRGQIATLLRQMGYEPLSTDVYRYYIEEQTLEDSITMDEAPDEFATLAAQPRERKRED